jgi:hypothetical protein
MAKVSETTNRITFFPKFGKSMEPEKENKRKRWLKRIGVVGFLFFLGKGILWLILGGALFKYCTNP